MDICFHDPARLCDLYQRTFRAKASKERLSYEGADRKGSGKGCVLRMFNPRDQRVYEFVGVFFIT